MADAILGPASPLSSDPIEWTTEAPWAPNSAATESASPAITTSTESANSRALAKSSRVIEATTPSLASPWTHIFENPIRMPPKEP